MVLLIFKKYIMFKKIITLILVYFISLNLNAQTVFDEGNVAFNAGFGIISANGLIPSIHASAEVGLIPTGNFGVISGGADFELKFSTLNSHNYTQIAAGARSAWHWHAPFIEGKETDLYAGLGLGLRYYSVYNFISHDLDPKISPYLAAFIGGRFMIEDNFGFFAELSGGPISAVKGGIVFLF